MIEWLSANIGTIIVGAIVLAILLLVVCYLLKNRKQGKTSCGCNCSGCPMSGSCHKQ
ncbi:MAG: FeoB-associated Cys-rich membrane protein [Acutalibacteraceae bacterium]|nr:FeoB-associated Cys-rich membrane protein [Acutalibacteraceae bacterium]